MELVEWIVEHCDHTYRKGNWAGRGVLPSIEGVTVEEASWRPNSDQHTIGELVLHMAYWKDAVTARVRGKPWEYNEEMDWRPVPPTTQGWEDAQVELQRSHAMVLEALRSLSVERLFEVVGKTWWMEGAQARVIDWAIGVTHHDTYHAAQIFVLRRLFKEGSK
jgi:uncharacterized damage-inducible protein DinB